MNGRFFLFLTIASLYLLLTQGRPSIASVPDQPLSFDDALSQILSRSTAIATQNANLGVTQANLIPARFVFAPSLSFDANETWVGSSGSTLNSSQVEGVAKINLLHWGADLANLHAANFDEDSQRATLDGAWLKAEDDGIRALIGEIQRKREVEVNLKIVKAQSQLLEIAKQRYSSGYLPLQEVDKVSVDLDNANASLADAQLRETESRTTLENFLGHSNIAADWPWKDRVFKVDVKAIAGESIDLSLRPDWKAANAKREAEGQRHQRNLRLLLPSVDSSLSYGNYSNPGATFGVPGSGAIGWTGVVSVTLPFFDHLVSYAHVRSQSYTLASAETAMTQVERDAKADWTAAKQGFTTALNTAVAREKTLTTSRRIYQDNFRRFQAGRISVNDLAIDQKRLFDSELFSVQGWSSSHLAFSRLCHAVGRRVSSCER